MPNDSTLDAGYYDHHPTVTLTRAIVIAGMIAAETRRIGYRVAALHGLRFVDLDRWLEHSEGLKIQELEEQRPLHDLRRLENRLLERAVGEEPKGVVTIADSALSTRRSRRLVQSKAHFVALRYTVEDCFSRFRHLYPGQAPAWIAEAPSAARLSSVYRQWITRFRGADLVLPMDGLSWEAAAGRLAAEIGDLVRPSR